MQKWRMFIPCLLCVLALLVTQCGAPVATTEPPAAVTEEPQGQPETTAKAPEDMVLAFIPKGVHPWYEPSIEGFKAATAELKVGKTIIVSPPTFAIDEQTQMIRDALTQGADAIAIAPIDATALGPDIDLAVEQGVPVVTWDSDCEGCQRTMFLGTDNTAAGKIAGELITEVLGNQGEITILMGNLGALNHRQRRDGFIEGLGDGIEVVNITPHDDDPAIVPGIVENWLTAYPDLVGMYDCTGTTEVGPVLAREGVCDRVNFVGWSDFEPILKAIREGCMKASVRQNPYAMGYLSAYALVELVQGGVPTTDNVDTGIVIITKDNIDSYADEQKTQLDQLLKTFPGLWK